MIDWTSYSPGQKLELTINEEGNEYKIPALLEEYEWSHHRKPYLAVIEVEESTPDGKWLKGDKIKLPIIWDEKIERKILVCSHCKDGSFQEIARETKISVN
jgi:hypothetical protein